MLVKLLAGDFLNVELVFGPIQPPPTPHIFFLDSANVKYFDVTNSTVPVVVGQPIYLFAVPSGSAKSQPWSVSGKPIGAYTATPCAGASCGAASVTAAEFGNPHETQFYWYISDTYPVTYYGLAGTAKTTFVVAPAPVPTVTAHEKTTGVRCSNYPSYCDIFVLDGTLEK
jgi:hypothetical protein